MDAVRRIPVPLVTDSAAAPPSEPCAVCPRIASEFEGWRQAAYWQAQHRRAVDREGRLKAENQLLQAQIRLLNRKIFGKSSEAKARTETAPTPEPVGGKRPRGQQPGRPSPAKRDHGRLPAVEEIHDLPEARRRCPGCDRPFAPFLGGEDSEILEIEVRAHRRVIRRPRYRPTCSCPENTPIVTAPPAPRVIPESQIGVSIRVHLLLDKYLFQRPT